MSPTQQSTQRTPRRDRPIEGKELRRLCGNFATGVTVVTAGGPGESVGVTANSFSSVSLDPPLVLFCLHRKSRVRPVLERSGRFAVNFLAYEQEPMAWMFAGRDSALIEDVPHHRDGAGTPVFDEALAFLSCRVVAEHDGGDHTIVVGEVVDLGESAVDRRPLIFHRGLMRTLGGAASDLGE